MLLCFKLQGYTWKTTCSDLFRVFSPLQSNMHTQTTPPLSCTLSRWPADQKKACNYQHCWPGKTFLVASSFTQNKWFKGELLNATSLLFWCCQWSNDGQLFSPEPLWQFYTSPGRVHLKVTVLFVHLSAPRGFCDENAPVKFSCENRSWQLHRVCKLSPRCFDGRRSTCSGAKVPACQGFSVRYSPSSSVGGHHRKFVLSIIIQNWFSHPVKPKAASVLCSVKKKQKQKRDVSTFTLLNEVPRKGEERSSFRLNLMWLSGLWNG